MRPGSARSPNPVLVSSVLARTEVVRAVARTDPDAAHLAVDLLAAVSVVRARRVAY
ncbi:MAG: hypothetical protein ACRDRE_23850 [Pseudonocardiaceae bacterium]